VKTEHAEKKAEKQNLQGVIVSVDSVMLIPSSFQVSGYGEG